MIDIVNKTNTKINLGYLKKVVQDFFAYFNVKNKEVSIALVGDGTIRRLNKIYRQKDKVTDVLSFDGEGDFLGEIIIDYAQIKRQAKRFNNTVKYELVFILTHGLLHLLGYEDKTEKGRVEMEKLAEEFLAQI